MTYLLDGTLGIVLVIFFLRSVHSLALRYNVADVIDSGYYGDPPRWRVWWSQLCGYLLALLLMKLTNFLLLLGLYRPLVSASNHLFASFANHRHLELLLVMVILPGVCNSFQFWVRSSHLRMSSVDVIGDEEANVSLSLSRVVIVDLRLALEMRRRVLEI